MSADPLLKFRRWHKDPNGASVSEWSGQQYRVQRFDADDVPQTVAIFNTERAAREYAAWKRINRVLITEECAEKTVTSRTVYADPECEEPQP